MCSHSSNCVWRQVFCDVSLSSSVLFLCGILSSTICVGTGVLCGCSYYGDPLGLVCTCCGKTRVLE